MHTLKLLKLTRAAILEEKKLQVPHMFFLKNEAGALTLQANAHTFRYACYELAA